MPRVINRLRHLPTEGFGPPGSDFTRTGRERRPELPEGSIWVGRWSDLASPFDRAVHGDAAIDMFRDYLREKVRRRDPKIMAALRRIRESSVLVCSCAPAPCSADVILAAWTALRDDGRFGIPDERDPECASDIRGPADPEHESYQWKMTIAADDLRAHGIDCSTMQRTALLKHFDLHCAARVREQAERTARARHPMDDDT